ncbi:hypothetical protein [Hymenobacter cheonanensis]|uniref:hypothetical protein n=1 Tax=Hymenobacter sp. CA2-7 TaxID=3063993 RepID=UPI002713E82B|nr:hypothetical protein [Hymenobacter sp. CA2-7]MDO7886911.1 hypothetical protein [Hymenobacter sp. CA2-7]
MTTSPENSQPSESKSPMTSENSDITSAAPSLHNSFQGPGAEDAWRRLRATRGNVVSCEEMIRRAQEQAAAKKK